MATEHSQWPQDAPPAASLLQGQQPATHAQPAQHPSHCPCLQEFRTPAGREFAKEFSPALNNIINFLVSGKRH